MGHSRGGEGMRAALAQYRDAGSPWKGRIGPVGFRAVYEIGPVDGQTSRTLDALGMAWNVLLPYCDGDVSDLEGVHPFDRMLLDRKEPARLPKSTFAVYGANHDFYNTEWQTSEFDGCIGRDNTRLFPQLAGSAKQRQTALLSFVPFMRAHVGEAARPALASLFDPDVPLPPALARITKIDRGYTDTPDKGIEARVEDFGKATGVSDSGQPELARGIGLEHTQPPNDDARQRAAAITWSGGGAHLFQTGSPASGSTLSLAGYRTLEFRASRQCGLEDCGIPSPLNASPTTDFTVQLVTASLRLSTGVRLASFLALRGPVGLLSTTFDFTFLHPVLMTAPIPLSAFGSAPAPPFAACATPSIARRPARST